MPARKKSAVKPAPKAPPASKEIDTDAPRQGPLGECPAQSEGDIIAAAAKDHEPGEGPNFPPEREGLAAA